MWNRSVVWFSSVSPENNSINLRQGTTKQQMVELYTNIYLTFKDETQTALFKDPVRTAQ